jgi:hypothetical protein
MLVGDLGTRIRSCLLDNSDVDGRSGTGAVDLCVRHCEAGLIDKKI